MGARLLELGLQAEDHAVMRGLGATTKRAVPMSVGHDRRTEQVKDGRAGLVGVLRVEAALGRTPRTERAG